MSVCFRVRWLVPVLIAVPLMFVIGWFTSEPLQGQDVDAVQKRLLKAVAKQELSLEQAAMMMRVLEDSAHPGHQDQGRQDQGRQQQGRQEQGRQQQGRQDQGRQQQGRQDHGRQDQGRQDQGRQQQGRQDQGRQDQGRQDQGRPMQQNRQGGPQRGPDRRSSQNDMMEQLERAFHDRMREIDEAVRSGQISEDDANRQREELERHVRTEQQRRGDRDQPQNNDLERMFAERMRAIEEAVRSGQLSEDDANRQREELERHVRTEQEQRRQPRPDQPPREPGTGETENNQRSENNQRVLSKEEVTKKYDVNGDGTLDYREKMSFLRSLDEDQKAAYRKQFSQLGPGSPVQRESPDESGEGRKSEDKPKNGKG